MKALYKSLICFICIGSIMVSCKNGNKKTSETKEMKKENTETKPSGLAFDAKTLGEEPVFIIKTTEGDIKVKLYKDTPLHRDNFIKLAEKRFYDGILFHRIIQGFMIQTGDPQTKDPNANPDKFGTGGPGYTVKAEIVPAHKHKKGALAAARRGDSVNPEKESSGSQFYIVENEKTCAQLDGAYTVFGETLEGFDVIDRIAAVETDGRDRPIKPVRILSVLPENAAATTQPADSTNAATTQENK